MGQVAEDRFEIYFAEKIWEMIPSIYRHEDGLAENPGVLRSIVELLAQQAAILRRSQDQLWEDQFIELCSDWTVPYIADLVGSRLVSSANKRGRRVDVAKTIYYRRRKGTPRILEELISDISGWEGKLVENFRRLARHRHRLDPFPQSFAGLLSGTQPGGWADLRQTNAAELADSPYDEYFHTPDMRQHRGSTGRYNIPKLAFHLYRLKAYRVVDSTPFGLGDGLRYTFDPSGRSIPLFIPRDRPESWDDWHSVWEWELPQPIRCRLLGHSEYLLTEAIIQALGVSTGVEDELRQFRGLRIRNEGRLRTTVQSYPASNTEFASIPSWNTLLNLALIEHCGKFAMLPNAVSVDAGLPEGVIPPAPTIAGNLNSWPTLSTPFGKRLIIDPEHGRFQFFGSPVTNEVSVTYNYGFSGAIGAGTYDRREVENCEPDLELQGGGNIIPPDPLEDRVIQINDSKTYGPLPDKTQIERLTFQAANSQRPYLRMESDWILGTLTGFQTAVLEWDGLWIGSGDVHEIKLIGDFECIIIRHCTIDPGGDMDAAGNPIPFVPITIEGQVELLVIDSSITGPIRTQGSGYIEQLVILDSILQSVDSSIPALELNGGLVKMNRTSIFGEVKVHRLQASEALITGLCTVTDTQNGCFRFSSAMEGSRVPQAYESHFFTDTDHWFTSRVFGHPGYAQLSQPAPEALQRGGENGSEIGAFNSLNNPIKLDSLQTKISEYMPFGLIPIFIFET